MKDFQLSTYYNIQSLFEMEIFEDNYLDYFANFNRTWEKVAFDCPDSDLAFRQWLSGKVAHDMCSALGEDFFIYIVMSRG